jgi:hypothetical protein
MSWLTVTEVHERSRDRRLHAEAVGGFLLVRAEVPPGGELVVRTAGQLLLAEPTDELPRARKGVKVAVPGLRLDPVFQVNVMFRAGDEVIPVGRIIGTAQFEDLRIPGQRQPVMVGGAGRTGTTWFMRLLLEHPQLALVDQYPYELRHAVALLHELFATSALPLYAGAPQPSSFSAFPAGRIAQASPFFAPQQPLFEWMATELFGRRVHHTLELIGALYDEVDREHGTASRYFAEKFVPLHLRFACHHLYDAARTIILVRDPRDVALSQLAFNERRGFEGFGMEAGAVDRACAVAQGLHATLHEADSTVGHPPILVRYEDLVATPESALEPVLTLLDVDATPQTIASMVASAGEDEALRDQHMTATDALASVGRWRGALTAAELDEIDERVGDLIDVLGYPRR